MFLYSILVSALIVVIAMTHLTWWSKKKGVLLASLLMGSLATLMVLAWGSHKCSQGQAPLYIAFVAGGLAGAVPWCRSFSLGIQRLLAFCIALLFVTLVGLLTSSYHSDGLTGNPELANGRYWHTVLSGQYPRGAHVGQHEQALMRCLRERVYQLRDDLTGSDEDSSSDEPKTSTQDQPEPTDP